MTFSGSHGIATRKVHKAGGQRKIRGTGKKHSWGISKAYSQPSKLAVSRLHQQAALGGSAKTWAWPQIQWTYRLMTLLTGKTLKAYSATDEERPDSFPDPCWPSLTFPLRLRQCSRDPAVPLGEVLTETYQHSTLVMSNIFAPAQSVRSPNTFKSSRFHYSHYLSSLPLSSALSCMWLVH